MRLIDYLLKETRGLERDFMLEYADSITRDTYHVIEKTDSPFEKTESFLKFARNILDGGDLPKGKERTKYFTWTKYIIETTRVVERNLYQIHEDSKASENMVNIVSKAASMIRTISDDNLKSDGSIRVYTSKLSYEEIEQMSQEELWNLVDIAIENAVVLSSFLRDHKKELFGGDNK